MGTVTRIDEYKQRDIGDALAELTEQWQNGELKGFVFACKFGDRHHGIGMAGEYRRDPFEVLGVLSRIEHRLNQIIEGRQNAIGQVPITA